MTLSFMMIERMSILYLIICLALGYLIGSIPFGVVLARVFNLGDLRQIGSGNIGATNVLRTGSKKAAILTLLLDALKGTVAVWIGFSLGGPMGGALAGLAAFLGHCFPVWLGFKGGKGVATFMGVLLALNLTAFFTFCAVWLIVAALTKYSSAAALAASSLALIPVFIGSGFLAALPVLVMIALLWWRHGENITRLRAGTESRISFGGSK